MYHRGAVSEALDLLHDRNLTYEKDGALWLRTSDFGDDLDRVLRKQDGSYTYFLPDIAYHIDKLERGFDALIDVWGADHHGYIPRVRAVLRALGFEDEKFDVVLVQLVKVVRGGEEVKMSKRAGTFVTLRDLVDEVGTDAARWFFLSRKGDSQLTFDIELAKRQTDENPIFYVQMAHARLCGIFRTAGIEPDSVAGALDLASLPAPEDTELLKKLAELPEVIAKAAQRAGAAPHDDLPARTGRQRARLVSPHAHRGRARRDRACAAAPRARRAHHPGQRPRRARPFRPRTDLTS